MNDGNPKHNAAPAVFAVTERIAKIATTVISGIYAITPDQPRNTADLLARTEHILNEGAGAIQYRNTDSTPEERLAQTCALVEMCHHHERPLIVYGDVQLAAQAGASGVHLGKDTANLSVAREVLGVNAVIGVSCGASMRRAVQAQMHGANYVTFGDLYLSASRPLASLAPLSLIRSAKDSLAVNVVAIGGITSDNAASVISSGADACAVTGLYDTPNSKLAAHALTALFNPTESIGDKDVD